jgi:hypothetical protein
MPAPRLPPIAWLKCPAPQTPKAQKMCVSDSFATLQKLCPSAWKRLRRGPRYEVKTKRRRRPDRVKQSIVEAREFKDIQLMQEHVAEFSYRPSKCKTTYRVVVVWKDIRVVEGQRKLFDDSRCFFYITNDWNASTQQIVFSANDRCNQENTIQQQKSDVRALTAPVDTLESN